MNAAALWMAGLMNLLAAIVVIALCLPLWWGRVPMNRWYGVRLPQAYRSEADWLRINRHGAAVFIGWSMLIAGLGLLAMAMSSWPALPGWAAMTLSLAGLLYAVAAIQLAWQARRL